MAGYIGSKTVNLSTTGADIVGDADVSGALDVGGAFTSQGIDDNATSTSMTLDTSGNLLVGTTSSGVASSSSNAGIQLNSSADYIGIARSGGQPLYLNRLSNDGTLIDLRKDGTTVGSIGTISGDLLVYSTASGHKGVRYANGYWGPTDNTGALQDNAVDLGTGVYRFDDIYATNGTIQTSDRNEKQDIEALSDAEQRVAVACKGLLRKFRWRDAVAEKGDEARTHFGIIAQDLQAAFAAEGLDAGDYAMFISSTWWEATETFTDEETGEERTRTISYDTQEEAPEGATERTRLGVRYSELLAFIIGAL